MSPLSKPLNEIQDTFKATVAKYLFLKESYISIHLVKIMWLRHEDKRHVSCGKGN